MDARTRLLLEGPVGSTILRLSLPNVIVMVVQTSIGLIETYFVAKLGLDALAGMALARLLPSPVMTAAGAWSLIPAAAPASPVFATVCRSLTAGLSAAAKERMCRDASPLTAPSG
jgi:hypothetical protein